MYKYSQQNAETYSKLGITGTTYEPGFDEARKALGDLSGKTVLDYGSGAGRTAKLLMSFGASRVIGVDHNNSMIEQADKGKTTGTEFLLIQDTIPFDDNTFDAALCAHVLVEVSSRDEMEQIFGEIHRVLKQGGIFVIITNNSKAIGMNYVSFQYEKNSELHSGQRIPIIIKGEKPFMIDDYYWTEHDYEHALKKVGFEVEDMTYPVTSDDGWLDETKVAPHVVITSHKK